MSSILIVDDEQAICWGFAKLGESMGHQVTTAASAEEGLRLAAALRPDLLILDVRLPGIDGLTALQQFHDLLAGAPVIVITAFGALETAVNAVRNGAFEYLTKPFDLAAVRSTIELALGSTQDIATIPGCENSHSELVGATPIMQSLFKGIALAAQSEANVLICGERGVGKELAARAIHQHSPQGESPFVAVNAAALSPTLGELELFGHVESASPSARRTRDGFLQKAQGGTLFLDEVADIPLPLQVKLLQAFEKQEFLPVGSDEAVPTSFRVIASTRHDLLHQVQLGKFRHDLYYNVCAFEVGVPALRERRDDIPLLSSYFALEISNGALSISKDALEEMRQRNWLGNVRELRNAIDHASVLARSGIVLPEHLPVEQPTMELDGLSALVSTTPLAVASNQRANELLDNPEASGMIYETFLKEAEAPLLSSAMQRFSNECAPAARALGLHRTTLKKKLKQHRLDSSE